MADTTAATDSTAPAKKASAKKTSAKKTAAKTAAPRKTAAKAATPKTTNATDKPAATKSAVKKKAAAKPRVAAKSRKSAGPAKPVMDEATRRALIAKEAYYIAERRGFAPGNEHEDWIEAEHIVAQRD